MNVQTPLADIEPRSAIAVAGVSYAPLDKPSYAPIPLAQPNAPRLSEHADLLSEIERSCRLSNYGPFNERFEQEALQRMFEGRGHCVSVCNATIGLILALKDAGNRRRKGAGNYVLMPSFTFAAAAHAVLWAGLTPLLVDIDRMDWAASREGELRALHRYGKKIAAVMPYAAFGSCIDLEHYDRLAEQYDIPVIIDGAPSLGSLNESGRTFGVGTRHTIVYSMHATKAFAVGEAGLVYSGDERVIDRLRRMGNFGFNGSRSAVMAGLNSKISEVTALAALIKLGQFDSHAWHRMRLGSAYREALPGCEHQHVRASRIAYQFMPVLLPVGLGAHRDAIIERASAAGIGIGRYFSPHIHEQPYFKRLCACPESLPVTEDVAARMLSLPISDFMKVAEVRQTSSFVADQIASMDCYAGSRW